MSYYADESVTLHHGDSLATLRDMPAGTVDCCVTSPPYFGLRDYGVDGQMGLEASPAEYVAGMRDLFAEVRRVLSDDGTFWLNIGDSYQSTGGKTGVGPNAVVGSTLRQAESRTRPTSGLVDKNLIGIPWRLAFALQDDGWILRNAVIWNKPNAMPESVTDRLSCRYEHVFLFSKSRRYWFDIDSVREEYAPAGLARRAYVFRATDDYGNNPTNDGGEMPANPLGKNPGDVWTIPTSPFPGAHFATMPLALAERCIKAGCKPGGTVLDPFSGSGTTGLAATRNGRRYVGIDLNAEYLDLSLRTRLAQAALMDGETA